MTAASARARHRGRWVVDPAAVGAFLAGILLMLQAPGVPTLGWRLGLAAAGVLALAWRRLPRLLGWCLLGIAWTAACAHARLASGWSPADDGRDVRLQFEVDGLPERDADAVHFDAIVRAPPAPLARLDGHRLRLAAYASPPPAFAPGERWEATLRLRAPHGSVNPGGFDFERHALQRGIVATGYLRESPPPRRLAGAGGVDALRDRLARRIDALAPPPAARFLRALSVGDTRGFSDEDWQTLRATGLSHLFAISGLHVGLVAGLGALLLRLIYVAWPGLGLRWPLPIAAALAGLAVAVGYAWLSGLGLPTLRTLLMLATALAAVALRRRRAVPQALALAAFFMAWLDPLDLLAAGFWLSFAGVGWLLMCLPEDEGPLRALLRAQVVLALGLLPLGILFFGQSSLVGVVLNLLAVPWVSLLVVPLALLGVLALPFEPLAQALFAAAGKAMQALWWLAGQAAASPWSQQHWPAPTAFALLLALAGAVWLLLPRGVPGRRVAWVLWLPLLLPSTTPIADGDFELEVLDVGQGLAVRVSTRNHHLLYDAGPRLRSGRDLGESVVVPSLYAEGIDHIDRLVLSHGDDDHAGGRDSVLAAFPAPVSAGEPRRLRLGEACVAGTHWRWDGVEFRWLHPPAHFPELSNQSSCVLQVRGRRIRALLPGDIDAVVERRLLELGAELRADWLVAPHHGSRSSSSPAFIAAVGAREVVFAAGRGNRFGHPSADVVARYREAGANVHNTAETGALRLQAVGAGTRVQAWRIHEPHFWRARPDDAGAVQLARLPLAD